MLAISKPGLATPGVGPEHHLRGAGRVERVRLPVHGQRLVVLLPEPEQVPEHHLVGDVQGVGLDGPADQRLGPLQAAGGGDLAVAPDRGPVGGGEQVGRPDQVVDVGVRQHRFLQLRHRDDQLRLGRVPGGSELVDPLLAGTPLAAVGRHPPDQSEGPEPPLRLAKQDGATALRRGGHRIKRASLAAARAASKAGGSASTRSASKC